MASKRHGLDLKTTRDAPFSSSAEVTPSDSKGVRSTSGYGASSSSAPRIFFPRTPSLKGPFSLEIALKGMQMGLRLHHHGIWSDNLVHQIHHAKDCAQISAATDVDEDLRDPKRMEDALKW